MPLWRVPERDLISENNEVTRACTAVCATPEEVEDEE